MPNETVAGLMVSIDGNTVKLRTELDKAARATKETSQKMRAEMLEARAGIKQVGEEIGVNLNRHLISFIAKLPGVAPVMATAFSGAAVVGIGMAIGESINRLTEWINKGREAASVLNEGFNSMHQASKLANDEQALTNDRLDDEIAKLTGKHQNALKDELDAARVEADKLWKSLEADNKAVSELLAKGAISGIKGSVTFKAPTEDTQKLIANLGRARQDVAEEYQNKIDAATSADEKKRIQDESRLALLAKEKQQLQDIEGLYNSIKAGHETRGGETYGGVDQDAVLGMLGGEGHHIKDLIRSQEQGFEGSDKTDQAKRLQAAKKAQEEAEKLAKQVREGWEADIRTDETITEAITRTALEGLDQVQEHRNALDADANRDAAYAAEQARKGALDRAESLKLGRGESAVSFEQTSQAANMRVERGQESPSGRTRDQLQALQQKHQLDQQSFALEAAQWEQGSLEYKRVLGERTKADQEYFKQLAELQKQAVEEGWTAPLMDLARQWTNWQGVLKQSIDSTLSSVNGELVRMMTTQYRRGDWKNATKPIFTGMATSGLQGAEGSLMKMIPGLGGMGKLGTRSNPMFVQMAGTLPSVASNALGGASSTTSAGGFLGFLGSVGKFFGFMETGGLMSPGGFYLAGERGPELVNVGSTSRIHNARDTSKMMGGGDTHHHWNIDARGATDPAAVERAAMRAVAKAAPHIAAGTIAAQRDYEARRPNMGR